MDEWLVLALGPCLRRDWRSLGEFRNHGPLFLRQAQDEGLGPAAPLLTRSGRLSWRFCKHDIGQLGKFATHS